MKNTIPAAAIFAVLLFVGSNYGQVLNTGNLPVLSTGKQVAAPLPKLALLGAEPYTHGRKKYHRIVMSVTNWDKYLPTMFETPPAPVLPPNPCGDPKARITAAVFGETGILITKCVHFRTPGSMQSFSFLVEKGAAIPKFVYLVLTDAQTGGAYRSNLVSPWTGLGK